MIAAPPAETLAQSLLSQVGHAIASAPDRATQDDLADLARPLLTQLHRLRRLREARHG